MKNKGSFIVIEGIDGSGKTSLLNALAAALRERGKDVVITKEPGGSLLGQSLRSILHTQEQPLTAQAEYLLFAADRSQHFQTIVIPALQAGKIVISDRCSDSSLAYQGYGRELDIATITMVNEWVMQGYTPDLVLYLKIDLETSLKRLHARQETLTAIEKRKEAFWNRVIKGFETIFASRDNVATIDATRSEEYVVTQALKELCKIGL